MRLTEGKVEKTILKVTKPWRSATVQAKMKRKEWAQINSTKPK